MTPKSPMPHIVAGRAGRPAPHSPLSDIVAGRLTDTPRPSLLVCTVYKNHKHRATRFGLRAGRRIVACVCGVTLGRG